MAARRPVTPELRQFVMAHDRRIAQATGQPFGDGYFEGLLRDPDAVLDSAPAITAVLAAEEVAGRGLDMLARVQQAHYAEGRRIADLAVLQELAAQIGLDPQAFASAFARLAGAATQAHIDASRALLARVGGHGFPTFAWEVDGRFTTVDIAPFLGQAQAWRDWLVQQVGPAAVAAAAADDTPAMCGIDGCAPQSL
jgi:putative protein-disulfide isomerase